jgi:hypothetical protein
MTLIDIHGRLANTAMFYVIIMAVWGLWRYFRRQGVEGSYWGALVIAEVLIILQALLGVTLWATGQGSLAGRGMHVLYGVVSVLVIPMAFAYTRGDQERRSMLVYGASFLFLVGIILRAISTAGA